GGIYLPDRWVEHVAAGFQPAFKFKQKLFWWLNAGWKPAATCSISDCHYLLLRLKRDLNQFCQVDCVAAGSLGYLFLTAETLCNDKGVRRGRPDGRKQHAFADGLRHVVFALLESERACHSAAACIWSAHLDSHLVQ